MTKMVKIKKWLDDNKIEWVDLDGIAIEIPIEKGCVWVNGFNEPMEFDKTINVYQNSYGSYIVMEKVGYSLTHKHCFTSRQSVVISTLENVLKNLGKLL